MKPKNKFHALLIKNAKKEKKSKSVNTSYPDREGVEALTGIRVSKK